MSKKINLTLKIWRQKDRHSPGNFETYYVRSLDTDLTFLEMLDVINDKLTLEGKDRFAFDRDCRDGSCGACGAVVNGQPFGPVRGTTLCQLYMRNFKDEETLVIEPWRSKGFPVNKDLSVDRSAFDRIISVGGFISVKRGRETDAHSIPVPKDAADTINDEAPCISCGACVAACPNGSAMLYVGSQVSRLDHLPIAAPEKKKRMFNMVRQMDKEGFGNCSNSYECEAACPKKISVAYIAKMNKAYRQANLP